MSQPENESATSLAYHGGNLDTAARLFPLAPKPWIDLSTGINSHAYPLGNISPAAWARLPQAGDIAALECIAAETYGAKHDLIAAPGTQALIQLLPRLIKAKSVGIFGFTYGEYARVWQRAGGTVEQVETLAALEDFDLAIIVNPNNPDGRLVPVADLAALANKLGAKGGHLLVDEAFMDFTPAYQFGPFATSNTLIFRSFGKTYGLAGLRLGFVLAEGAVGQAFRDALGPWAISGPAIEIASAALADKAWLQKEAARLDAARKNLEAALKDAGFTLLDGTHLFCLAQHPQAQDWFRRFAEAGVLLRPFAHNLQWLRFGIPSAADFSRVLAVLVQNAGR